MTTVIEFYIPENERTTTKKLFEKHFDSAICSKIEKGIFKFTEQFCMSNNNYLSMAVSIYKDSRNNLLFNFNNTKNRTTKNLIKKINAGNYNPFNLAFLKPEEMDEDKWKKIRLRKDTTEDRLKNLPTVEWRVCKDCKNKEYFHYQLQTRSADEPMTNFYICKKCSRTYKVNN